MSSMIALATVWIRRKHTRSRVIKVGGYYNNLRERHRGLVRGHKGGGEKWLDPEYILKVEPRGFADPTRCEKKTSQGCPLVLYVEQVEGGASSSQQEALSGG